MEKATFLANGSFCDNSFWNEVGKRKVNDWKLDESAKEISATFSTHDVHGTVCRLSFSHESFGSSKAQNKVNGTLLVLNTIESFKNVDWGSKSKEFAKSIWESISNERWLDHPEDLFQFGIVCFANLKSFTYLYWACFPALTIEEVTQKSETFDGDLAAVRSSPISNDLIFLLIGGSAQKLANLRNVDDNENVVIVIQDSSPVEKACCWTVRNLLAAVAALKPKWKSVRVLSLRGSSAKLFTFAWKHDFENAKECPPSVLGWERNSEGQLKPMSVNLKTQLDSKKLMDQSVNLNLSLIKWRLLPELDLDRITTIKALILGAGTLGCNLARCLLGWGVKSISFVDNSVVSYSNPVRQSLSTFQDACDGTKKADAAASALRKIYPSVEAEAHELTIPMPGHTVDASGEERIRSDVEKLDGLIARHDVVFLALDSREARWLPTIIANKYNKIAISLGLGFDSFVVLRHGIGRFVEPADQTAELVPYNELSCYFCSDVTAPGNSTSDRTLDQQCTVSRPGLSMIAAANGVELLASILQHPTPLEAPSNIGELDTTISVLGAVPHQIRGFMFRFNQITPCVRRFSKCVACGPAVADAYENDGWKFVVEVLNKPSRLEEITGLQSLQDSINDISIDFDDDSDSVVSL